MNSSKEYCVYSPVVCNFALKLIIGGAKVSDMCFDDFDYDRHSDMCDCEECTSEIDEPAQQPNNRAKYIICPNCGGEGSDNGNGSRHCRYCDFWW